MLCECFDRNCIVNHADQLWALVMAYVPLYQFQPVGFCSEFAPNYPTFAAVALLSSSEVSAFSGACMPIVPGKSSSHMIEYYIQY